MALLDQIGRSVLDPIATLWDGFVALLPGMVGAILVLIIGYIIAAVIASVVLKILKKVKLNKWLVDRTGMKKVSGSIKLSELLALLTKWYIFILFLPAAADLIQLTALGNFLNQLAVWIPNVIIAVLIAFAGFIGAAYIGEKIVATGTRGAKLIADLVKAVIIITVLLVALEQVSIRVGLLQNSLLIIIGGVVFAISLGLGLAFGLGGTEDAKKLIATVRKKL